MILSTILSNNLAVATALGWGIVLGIVLVITDLADRTEISLLGQLRQGQLSRLLTGSMFIGLLLATWFPPCTVDNNNPWSAVIGGILTGLGLYLTGFTPGSALAALGRGKAYAFYLLTGVVTMLTLGQPITEFLKDQLQKCQFQLPSVPDALPWQWDEPRFYALLMAAALWLLFIIIFGRNSNGQPGGKNNSANKPVKGK